MSQRKSRQTRLAESFIRLLVIAPRGILLARIALLKAALRRLRPEAVAAVHPHLLAQLPLQVLAQLAPPALAQLDAETLEQLPKATLEKLDPAVLARLKPEALHPLDPQVLAQLDVAVIRELDPQVVGSLLFHLPTATIKQLPIALLQKIPPTALQHLDTDLVGTLHPQVLEPIVFDLPLETLKRLPIATLQQMPQALLLRLDIEILRQFHPDALAQFDDALLEHINPTLIAPLSYNKARADQVYGEAFRRCIEYLKYNRIYGTILEFGTYRGYTAGVLAQLIHTYHFAEISLHLFDSFEGLPAIASPVDQQSYDVQSGYWEHSAMSLEQGIEQRIYNALLAFLPPERLTVTKGYFEDTLPHHLPAGPVALVHIDADLYSSARFVLDYLLAQGRLQDGALLLFDDYNSNRANPRMGERQALVDAFQAQARYSYSPFFSYGWHGMAFFVHDAAAGQPAALSASQPADHPADA